jgi:prepilin-type processing-associated H-X9-DG protein
MQPTRARLAVRLRHAFTLIEALVIVGIMALLTGLLVPALHGVHSRTQCTVCLNNLRQVHYAVTQYAMLYDDQVPLGYRGGNKQWNSMVYSATTHRFVLFGLLYRQGLMRSPDVFFCPAEHDERSTLNSAINPWPPGPGFHPELQTYCGYGARPETNIPDDLATAPKFRLPTLAHFQNQAILADLTATPQRLDTRHSTGVNVLYGDGSARWIDRTRFDFDLSKCPAISPNANPFQDNIWNIFDQR